MSASSGQELVERYLEAYKVGNSAQMEACMDEQFTFSDPAFPALDTKHAKGMFAMFIVNRDKNKMELEYKNIKKGTDDLTYTATYTVRYLFNGRPVTNVITPTFTISPTSNLLLSQVDDFSFYTWAKQALGISGLLLGWTGFLQGQVQKTAGGRLEHFLSKSEQK